MWIPVTPPRSLLKIRARYISSISPFLRRSSVCISWTRTAADYPGRFGPRESGIGVKALKLTIEPRYVLLCADENQDGLPLYDALAAYGTAV